MDRSALEQRKATLPRLERNLGLWASATVALAGFALVVAAFLLASSSSSTPPPTPPPSVATAATLAPAPPPPPPTRAPAVVPWPDNGAAGSRPGDVGPRFMLPVVNHFSGGSKWGPAKWEGKKLVLIAFFAAYCVTCRDEMPELERLYEAYEDQGLGVMVVAIDKEKEPVLDGSGVTFPVLHDRFQVVARRYNAVRLPYVLMLDATGAVKTSHAGYTDAQMAANLENDVRQGLGLSP